MYGMFIILYQLWYNEQEAGTDDFVLLSGEDFILLSGEDFLLL